MNWRFAWWADKDEFDHYECCELHNRVLAIIAAPEQRSSSWYVMFFDNEFDNEEDVEENLLERREMTEEEALKLYADIKADPERYLLEALL